MCSQYVKDSIIWSYANHNGQQWFVDCGCANVCNTAASCSLLPSPISGNKHNSSRQRGRWQKPCNIDKSGRQAPTSFCSAFLWSHLLCKIAVLFYKKLLPKMRKKHHMPWAADLCFLYLHVSQNTALYRNCEQRLQQTSSRTWGFVSKKHIKVEHTRISYKMQNDRLLYKNATQTVQHCLFLMNSPFNLSKPRYAGH